MYIMCIDILKPCLKHLNSIECFKKIRVRNDSQADISDVFIVSWRKKNATRRQIVHKNTIITSWSKIVGKLNDFFKEFNVSRN